MIEWSAVKSLFGLILLDLNNSPSIISFSGKSIAQESLTFFEVI